MISNPKKVVTSEIFHFGPQPSVAGLIVSQNRSMVSMITDSFFFIDSTENAGLIHFLLIACFSLSVSVKLLYVPAAMSKVLYHSPFLTLAFLGA